MSFDVCVCRSWEFMGMFCRVFPSLFYHAVSRAMGSHVTVTRIVCAIYGGTIEDTGLIFFLKIQDTISTATGASFWYSLFPPSLRSSQFTSTRSLIL